MRTLLLNGDSGISGDMLLGLIVDLGVPVDVLEASLRFVNGFASFSLEVETVVRSGVPATSIDVVGGELALSPEQLREVARQATLSDDQRALGLAALDHLIRVESEVHGTDHVHLHELGSLDTIVDVFGVIAGLAHLGVDSLAIDRLSLGSGSVEISHGRVPNPTPASILGLRGSTIIRANVRPEAFEFSTPTGIAILRAFESAGRLFRPSPMHVEGIGYGAGKAAPAFSPNLLQGILGETDSSSLEESIVVLETHIDDLSGEMMGGLVDEALVAGAVDAWFTNVGGKKSRPGYEITLLVNANDRASLIEWLHLRTGSPGVRWRIEQRDIHPPQFHDVVIEGHRVRIKATAVSCKPEFSDVARVAQLTGLPPSVIAAEAMAAFRSQMRQLEQEHEE
ncbi:MAG: LarC family nickel insertion protein [Acidimicrobiales bacterium]